MRLSVRHETLYRYSGPVAFAPHLLRLHPRAQGANLLTASLSIEPTPVARQDTTDRFGNRITEVSFAGVSDVLRIESAFEIDIPPAAPLRDPGFPLLPWPAHTDDGLSDYRTGGDQEETVKNFAAALAADSGWRVLPFLDKLTRTLFTRFDRHIRTEGAAHSPAQTLATGRGACRDLSVLFIAAARSLGIAARFVSGYQARAESVDGQRHLHAWAEVCLPDLGWRGFDPTHGTVVDDGHTALCAAPDQSATMPIEGGYYGNGITSTLDFKVHIESW